MVEGYKCRYNYVLLETDESTDSGDEEVSLLPDKIESNFHFIDKDLGDIKYDYIWLSDSEILSESRDCAIKKVGKDTHVEEKVGKDTHVEEKVGKDTHVEEKVGKDTRVEEKVGKDTHVEEKVGKVSNAVEEVEKDTESRVTEEENYLCENLNKGTSSSKSLCEGLTELKENKQEELKNENTKDDESDSLRSGNGEENRPFKNSFKGLDSLRRVSEELTELNENIHSKYRNENPTNKRSGIATNGHGIEYELSENVVKDIDSPRNVSNQVIEISENKQEKCKIDNLTNDRPGSVEHSILDSLVHGCRTKIANRYLTKSDSLSTSNELKKDHRKLVIDVKKGDTSQFPAIANKANTCDAHKKGTIENICRKNGESRNGINYYNGKSRNTNKIQLKKKTFDLNDCKGKNLSLDNAYNIAGDRKSKKRKPINKARFIVGMKRKTTKGIARHVRDQKDKECVEECGNDQYSEVNGKRNHQINEEKPSENKTLESKYEVLVTDRTSGDNFGASKTDENDVISELCPVFDRCALDSRTKTKSLLKMALKEKKEYFKEMSEPGKHSHKVTKDGRSKSLPSHSKTDCVKEGFWVRKDQALFCGLKQMYNESSKVQSSSDVKTMRESDNRNNELSQFVSRDLKTNFTNSSAVKTKMASRLSEMSGNSKMTENLSPAKLTKVRNTIENKNSALESLQTISLSKCTNWLRCMPTPTTGKLLKRIINKAMPLKKETIIAGEPPNSEPVQNVCHVCEFSNLPMDKVDEDTELSNIELNETVILTNGKIKEMDVSTKEQVNEHSNQIQHFTDSPVDVSEGEMCENEEIMCSPNEMCQQNIKQLGGKTRIADQKSFKYSHLPDGKISQKGKDKANSLDLKRVPCKNRPDVKTDASRFKRTHNKRKGKEIKVFRTVKGIGKIAFRYPCKYCGELFSKGYILRHEKTHLAEGCNNLSQGCDQRMGADTATVPEETVSEDYSDKEAATTMPSPTVLGADINTDHGDIKTGVTKTGKIYSRLTKESPGESFIEKETQNGSLHGNGGVTELINIKTSSSTPIQSRLKNSYQAQRKRRSFLTNAAKTGSKVGINANKIQNYLGLIKRKSRSELFDGKYSCTMCKYSSPYHCYLKRHLSVHGCCSRTVTCKCGITFRNGQTRSQWHKRNNISVGMEHVKKVTNLARNLSERKVHSRLEIENQNNLWKGKGKGLKSFRKVAKRKTFDRLKCEKCNYKFSNTSNWIRHQQLHKNKQGYSCQECSITMKSKHSLAFWHRRHGIHHLKTKHERRTKMEKKERKNEFDPCDISIGKERTKTREVTEIQSCGDCNAHILVKDIEHIRLNEKLDGTTCDKCSLKVADKQMSISETLGRVFEREHGLDAGDKIDTIDTDNKSLEKYPVNTVRESINNSLKELSLKFEGQLKDKSDSRSINQYEANKTDSDFSSFESAEQTEVVRQVSDNVEHSKNTIINKDKDFSIRERGDSANCLLDNQEDITKHEGLVTVSKRDIIKTTFASKELPVYPLLRRLSLQDGEQVYSPVNDEIEVFEKECDINKKYRKVRVLNIDTNGCQEKKDVLQSFIPYSGIEQQVEIEVDEGDGEKMGILPVGDNSEVNLIEPLDLSVKKYEQKSGPVKANSKFSISFQIQIDFEGNNLTSCRPSNLLTSLYQNDVPENLHDVRSPNEVVNCSHTAKVFLKNIQAISHNDNYLTVVDNCNISRITLKNNSSTLSKHSNETVVCQRNDSILESVIRNQNKHYGEMKKAGHKKDVYTFTDDEGDDDDDVFYYASKLQGISGSDGDTTDFDYETYGQLRAMGVNTVQDTMEDPVCDTGGTDEKNNREQDGGNEFTDKRSSRIGGNNNRNGSYGEVNSGGGEGHGNGDRDEDDKENNDRNNNFGNNSDEIQNVELLPCLVCQAIFNNKTELLRHLTKIHRLTNLCQICYFDEGGIRRFANPVSLRNHKVRDHPEDMVKCVCGAMLIDNKMLSSHLKKFKCNIYESGGESNEMAKCICGKRFSSPEMLLNHRSKCRKRHCLDETFLEFMNIPSIGKKRRLKTSQVENRRTTETIGMTLRAKSTDMNNNISLSEDSDTSLGRTTKVRKCKGKVVSYSEKADDKFFETAVNLSKMSRRKLYGEAEHTRRYGRLPWTQKLSEGLLASNDEVLDLRTKSARDRNIDTLTDGSTQLDINNNYAVQGTSASYIEVKKDDELDNLSCTVSVRSLEEEKINSGIDKNVEEGNIAKLASRSLKTETKSNIGNKTKLVKSNTATQSKKKLRGKGKKKSGAEGKYPCKMFRRRYKKPYLYTHKRIAHARKQWILVPTVSLEKNSECSVKYRCRWCRFVSLHWGTAVRHHYMEHQNKELDLITLMSIPKVFPDQLQDSSVHHLLHDLV